MRNHLRPRALALTCALLFVACSQAPAPSTDDPYAGGRTYPWEQQAAPGLTSQSLTPGVNTLQYETPTFAANSWGPVEKNRSNGEQQPGDGRPLTLAGQRYAQGYEVHAGSELRFSLKGTDGAQCFNFTADVGVDDEVGDRGSVVFQVFTDGTQVYDSGPLTGASATKRVNVGVVGKQELRLVVTDAGDGIAYDHADWADPRLACATQPPRSGSLDTSWGELEGIPVLGGNFDPGRQQAVLAPDNTVVFGDNFVIQPDSKIITVTNLSTGGFELRRTLSRGGADPSFGQAGKVTSNFGPKGGVARDAVLQPDGKLVVTGGYSGPAGTDFALARYLPNGNRDLTFGQGGVATADFAPEVARGKPDPESFRSDESAQQVALGADGALVVLGAYDSPQAHLVPGTFGLARFTPGGQLDLGTAAFPGGLRSIISNAISATFALTSTGGGLVVWGGRNSYAFPEESLDWLALNRTRSQDSETFLMGQAGGVSTGTEDLAAQRDGKVLAVATVQDDPYDDLLADGVLVRFNADLTVDRSFGNDGSGTVVVENGGRFVDANTNPYLGGFKQVLVQPDGKIVAIGRTILRFWP